MTQSLKLSQPATTLVNVFVKQLEESIYAIIALNITVFLHY